MNFEGAESGHKFAGDFVMRAMREVLASIFGMETGGLL